MTQFTQILKQFTHSSHIMNTVHTHFGTNKKLFTHYDTVLTHFDTVHIHFGTVHTLLTHYDTVHTHFHIVWHSSHIVHKL